jgi:DNA-binding response OmpR family regulator
VVVLSAHLTGASTAKLRGLGVFKTLAKPADTDELVAAVREGIASDRRSRLANEAPAPSPASPTQPKRGTILVADDDEGIRGLLNRVLTKAGYDVVLAVDGEEAVEKALANDIDLIMLDLNMPRMDGYQAVTTLKAATRDCFIIVMTGEAGKAELDRATRAGAMSTFRKPFDIDEVTAEVNRLDLIASHRRKLAARERAREEMHRKWTLAERTQGWLLQQEHRFGRRFKLVVALAVFVALVAGLAVPIVTAWASAAADAARSATDRFDEAMGAASRIEGYLQRDEARELK